jgi:hypothetical protein
MPRVRHAAEREQEVVRRPTAGDDRRAPGATVPLVTLHQAVGNRAFARAFAPTPVQRHEGPTSNEEVGAPAADAAVEAGVEPGPAPGTGTTGPAGVGLTGDARKKAIEDTLRGSATGLWSIGVLTKWKIPVDYEYAGQGSYHQAGKIFINKTLGVGAAAIVMMHEAQHADTFKSGKAADRMTLSRADYITQRIADEAEAVVRQIEGLAVTSSMGVDMSGNPISAGLKERYLKAFYAKRDALAASNPAMTTAQINAACRTHTRDTEVTNWFHDGTFVTSTDNNSYAVFYGKQWDDVHKAPGT